MKINKKGLEESEFLKGLGTIALKPKMLYCWGELPTERPKCVAIVGARKYTKYGEEVAYRAAFELAQAGIWVISGLALGIDSIAHRGTLAAGGKTVAVLGTAIERISPRRHVGLAEEIVEKGGAILSEYAESDKFFPANFLYRNRLISGLADAVLIVEAGERSGTLNTAAHALEQGRDLWVVPGDINRPNSVGCNRLILQGAMPYTSAKDILTVLLPGRKQQQKSLDLSACNETEKKILTAIFQGLRDGAEIIKVLKMSASEFNCNITLLEVRGRVRSLGANQWTLA